jgi:molybdate transport system substrate-binding protein
MGRRISKLGSALMLISFVAGVGMGVPATAETLSLAAAPSLRAPFQEILRIFEQEYDVTVEVRYGASHTLRRQIEQGAAIDVFLSESVQDIGTLHQKGLTRLGGPRHYAQTSMVVVMSSDSPATAISFGEASLNGAVRVAVVDPKASRIGAISVKALKQMDPLVHRHARVVPAAHSDDVVRLVSAGDADIGIVYRADAINNGQVRIIDEMPAGGTIPVVFAQAIVSTCREASLNAAEHFVNFMMSPRVQKLLLKYGFDAMPTVESVG